MASQEVQRKLTAILSADVAGYSRLMGADEAATVETLTAYRQVFISEIARYRGRVVDAKGDAILAEFASVVDAVTAAVEIQRGLAERNTELPEERQMEFRIGVNLGDVIVQENVIYGDGVNIAARLESLAEPGSICISGSVHEQVKNRLPLHFQDIGEQEVKNIADPVRAYKVLSQPGAAAHRVVKEKRRVARRWRLTVAAVAGVALLAVGGFLGWNAYRQSLTESPPPALDIRPALELPDRPSIAVLPFDNLGGDPLGEKFSDGFTESVITSLAKVPRLFVIARNSSSVYKGKAVNIGRVGRELGVKYVLEGSVQRADGRLRVSAQLIEAATGRHLWADSWDRESKDFFAVMDDITRNVVTELRIKLTWGEGIRYSMRETRNFEAMETFWKGVGLRIRFRKDHNLTARETFLKAMQMDPGFARPIALVGFTHLDEFRFGWSKDRAQSFKLAEEWARRAIATNEASFAGHWLLGEIHAYKRQYQLAIAESQRAVELEPNNHITHALLGRSLTYAGRPQEAMASFKISIRINPFTDTFVLNNFGQATHLAGRYEEAFPIFRKVLERLKTGVVPRQARLWIITGLMELGRKEEVRAEVEKFIALFPEFSLRREAEHAKREPFKDPAVMERHIELLRQVGLPE